MYYIPVNKKCKCCKKFFQEVNSVTLEDESLNIIIDERIFLNNEIISFKLPNELPDGITSNTLVTLFIGKTKLASLPIVTQNGNFLYGSQITPGECLMGRFATDTSVFVLSRATNLKKSFHKYSTIPII